MLNIVKLITYFFLGLSLAVAGLLSIKSIKGDDSAGNLISAPGAYEQYKERANQLSSSLPESESLLVKQAKAFALRLNPPAVEAQTPKIDITKPIVPRRPDTGPAYTKFTLIGTCVNESNPSRSLAMLDIPGSGQKWVFKGDTVNRIVIDEILPGKIVFRDGSKKQELFVPAAKKVSLLKSDKTVSSQASISANNTYTINNAPVKQAMVQPEIPVIDEVQAKKENIEWLEELSSETKDIQLTEEEKKEIAEFAEFLKDFDETQK